MSDFDVSKIKNSLQEMAHNKLAQMAEQYAALLQYEIGVINIELASQSKTHGYDYEYLPETLMDGIKITGSGLEVKVSVPQEVMIHLSDSQKNLLQLCLSNTNTKMRGRTASR